MTAIRLAILTALLATPAFAEIDAFKPGMRVMQTADYDSDTDRFLNQPPKGEGDACFEVISVSETEVELRHLSGNYHPWWSDTPILAPGEPGAWFDSDAWRENRPNAAPLEQLRKIFSETPNC